jgi:hypothetical protein
MVGGIRGNVMDRIQLGYVIDFIAFGSLQQRSTVLNLADLVQWVGYFFIFSHLLLRSKFPPLLMELRKRYWINPRFQIRYCLLLMFISLSSILILGVYSYTYLSVALSWPGTSIAASALSSKALSGSFIATFQFLKPPPQHPAE